MEQTVHHTLYDLLITRNLEPRMLDSNGQDVMDPNTAEMFTFDWKTPNHDYGTVVVMITNNEKLEIFFGNNITKSLDPKDSNDWYNFLNQLKQFAVRNLLGFQIKNISRLKYTMQGMAAIKEGLFEGYYGKKDVSYSDRPNTARVMIKHNRDLGKDEARYRAIESLFIENAEGERFKLPFKSLTGAKIMARHVKEGGKPYDAFGNHIVEIMSQINTLGRFLAATKNKQYDAGADPMIEIARSTYTDLKAKAKRMIGRRGYHRAIESFDPAEISNEDRLTDDIKELFIERTVDSRIEEALPLLAQLSELQEKQMKEVNQFESWANGLVEGTWALPETDAQVEDLEKILSKPLPCGPDGMNATNAIYDIVGDDALFDDIAELSQQDPDADARPLIVARLEEFGFNIDTTDQPAEDLDTDGVMMTRPSNMSSESVEETDEPSLEETFNRLIKNAGIF